MVKRTIGLFEHWAKNFDLVMQSKLIPVKGDFFLEQSVLSATISAMELSVKVLPEAYNFHLLKHTKLDEAIQKIENGEIKMLHYHTAFNFPQKIKAPKSLLADKNTSTLYWINAELKQCAINEKLLLTEMESTFNLNKEELLTLFSKNE